MSRPNLICIVVDRVHAGMLGAYGNSWIKSKHFDHLASESFLFDQALIESPRLDRLYRAYWHAAHPLHGDVASRGSSLPRIIGEGGWHTALLTDDAEIVHLSSAADFHECQLVDASDARRAADDVSQTQMTKLFEAVIAWLQTTREPFCLWVHARGMAGAWDAPLALRNQFADEEDPTPLGFVAAPDRWLTENDDPGELLGIAHAYAAQISVFDACIGALADHLSESGLMNRTLLTLLSARGFPLGEHRRVGPCDEPMYNEMVQVPWLVRFPDGLGKLARSGALVQPADLPGTLLDWLELDRGKLLAPRAASLLQIIRGDSEAVRQFVYSVSGHDRAIRTPAWTLRQPAEGPAELYAKPSDRWEMNEVAKLCDDVVAGLQAVMTEFEQSGAESELPPLADILVTEVD